MCPTYNQLLQTNRIPRKYKNKRPDLKGCPQRKGTCLRTYVMTPRKPNSALRKVARVGFNPEEIITAFIPGIGHSLAKFSTVLVRGGKIKDLPGIKYQIVRGKFDLRAVVKRATSRSKYGAKRWAR